MSRCTRANSGHPGICTACPSTPQRTVHTGDVGPRRVAWTFSMRSEKEVIVCASLTNDGARLSLVKKSLTIVQEFP
jgi:hypothetical protein